MTLVVGATGLLGLEVCRLLADEGRPTRALVRSSTDRNKIAQLERLGVEIVQGDLKDRDSLAAACRDSESVISTASSTISRQTGDSIRTVDLDGQINLIDAAKDTGVQHFVFISFRQNRDLKHPLDSAKRAVERRLKESGVSYTILQAGFFMEVWLSPALGFDYANARARIYGDGKQAMSWISFKDVARFAVSALDNPAARNAVVEIGGPEALSPLKVVSIFEEIGGRPFAVEHVPVDALQAQKESAADPLQESFAGLMLTYAQGDAIEMDATLKAFPVQLASVRDYAGAVLGRA